MAGSVVSYVVKRVGDFLVQEAVFLYEVRDQVDWVQRELRRMQCFLEDADAKRKRDERVSNWVKEVRDAAYEAQDLVESFVLEAELRRRRRKGFTGYVWWCVCVPRQLSTHHQFGEEIQLLKAKIGEISSSRSTYGIENLGTADGGERNYVDDSVRERRRVALHADDSDVVGMGDEKENILKRLFDQSVTRRAVISIVGMGGLGKTTLAKKVYNTVEIKSHFDCWAWINISQQYRVVELLQDMVKKVAGIKDEETEKMKREELEEKLHTFLEGKKYLIVMDDVWGNDVWNTFRSHLPDVANGSRVLFTTRSIDVARVADPCALPYELRLLNDEESWALFSKKVFPHQDVETVCTGKLRELGKQIAKKCGGLPLALVVLGGFLSRKDRSITIWGKLADAIGWQHSEDGQVCLEILALSYNDLPHHLKWCFLYLGSFPEDFEIDVEKLARLWIAEGFVTQKEGETLEESAEGYVNVHTTVILFLVILFLACTRAGRLASCSILYCPILGSCTCIYLCIIQKVRQGVLFFIHRHMVSDQKNFSSSSGCRGCSSSSLSLAPPLLCGPAVLPCPLRRCTVQLIRVSCAGPLSAWPPLPPCYTHRTRARALRHSRSTSCRCYASRRLPLCL